VVLCAGRVVVAERFFPPGGAMTSSRATTNADYSRNDPASAAVCFLSGAFQSKKVHRSVDWRRDQVLKPSYG
jgi:hypothetical protein